MTTCVICGAVDTPCPHDGEPNYFTALKREDLLQSLWAERRVKEATQKICYEKDRELELTRAEVRKMREALEMIAKVNPNLWPSTIAKKALGLIAEDTSRFSTDDDGRCRGCGNKGGGHCQECF